MLSDAHYARHISQQKLEIPFVKFARTVICSSPMENQRLSGAAKAGTPLADKSPQSTEPQIELSQTTR
jgi:hypothetical protein